MATKRYHETTVALAQMALFAALCYIGFQFLRIDIPLPGGKTALHLGNAFCVLAALLLGGVKGGLAGAVGMTIADLTSGYATSAPQTFIMKFCIGLIVGAVAHHVGHLSEQTEGKKVFQWSLLGSVVGMAFNVLVDPVMSYIRKRYFLGAEPALADILAKWSALSTFVNAIAAVLIAVLLYAALAPVLRRSGLLLSVGKAKKAN